MFPGAGDEVPLGGAGASEYYLAEALSQQPGVDVYWVFPEDTDISRISHPTIEIVQPRVALGSDGPVLRGGVFSVEGPRFVLAPTFFLRNRFLWNAAVEAGCTPIIRVASDVDLITGRPQCVAEHLVSLYAGAGSDAPWLVVQSEWQRQRAIELLTPTHTDRIIHQPKGWTIPPDPPEWIERSHILWVGTCKPVKQPWTLLTLARMFPDQQFAMVMPPFGGKRTDLYSAIMQEAATLDNVEIIGRQIPIGQVDELFRHAKLYVLSSAWEGFASTLMQAGAAAVPVASLNVDPDGYIERCSAGFVADGSVTELARGVSQLLADDETGAREAGIKSWRYARENHSMDDSVRRLLGGVLPEGVFRPCDVGGRG